MKKTILATVVFLFLLVSCVWSFEIIPVWYHIHTNSFSGDDGSHSIADVIKKAKSMGIRGIVFTPHPESLDFRVYRTQVESFTNAGFITIAGREVQIAEKKFEKLCHTSCISENYDPYLYDPQYGWKNQPEVMTILHSENAFCVVNHLKDCPEWSDMGYLLGFDGIEFFNDYYVSLTPSKIPEKMKDSYLANLYTYLKAIRNKWQGTVVGGLDLHNFAQLTLGNTMTYIFPDKFEREAITQALREGKTAATRNLLIVSLNIPPSRVPYQLGSDGNFLIKGSVKPSKMSRITGVKMNVYQNGELTPYQTLKLAKSGTGVFTFIFSGKINDPACFVLEIPEAMITSPFCFQKEPGPQPLPGKVFRVTKVTISQMFYRTEKEGLEHPYPSGLAFEYCYKDFMLTPDGFIFGCQNPFMIKGVADEEDGAVLYYAPEVYKNFPVENVEKSFAVALGKNEFKCMTDEFQHHIIISVGKNVEPGDKFYACDPDGPITYNQEDESISCNETCEGEASYPGMSSFWTFHEISGDCPINNLGSIWIVPKDD